MAGYKDLIAFKKAKQVADEVWLDFSNDYKYLPSEKYQSIVLLNNEVGKLLGYMIEHPEKFIHHV